MTNHPQWLSPPQGCPSIFPQNATGTITATTGTIFRNPGTELVVASILNQDPDRPHTVTVSVLDWQNTCNPTEYRKFAYFCGNLLNPPENGNGMGMMGDITIQNGLGPFDAPLGFLPILIPFTFTLPPLSQLIIHAYPTDPVLPPSPLYEVAAVHPTDPVFPSDPVFPTDPVLPTDPVRPIIINTWGIDVFGAIQEGNTVLHNDLLRKVSLL